MNTENNETYKIEKGIQPPPARSNLYCSRYPLREMEVGDSFLIDKNMRSKVQCACTYFSIRNPAYRFSVRNSVDGLRVWRVEANKT